MDGPFKNEQNQVSGAKGVLLAACLPPLGWLWRDLLTGRELSEAHAALMGLMLIVGLINRVSARGRFKVRLGRDGGELEADNRDRDH